MFDACHPKHTGKQCIFTVSCFCLHHKYCQKSVPYGEMEVQNSTLPRSLNTLAPKSHGRKCFTNSGGGEGIHWKVTYLTERVRADTAIVRSSPAVAFHTHPAFSVFNNPLDAGGDTASDIVCFFFICHFLGLSLGLPFDCLWILFLSRRYLKYRGVIKPKGIYLFLFVLKINVYA